MRFFLGKVPFCDKATLFVVVFFGGGGERKLMEPFYESFLSDLDCCDEGNMVIHLVQLDCSCVHPVLQVFGGHLFSFFWVVRKFLGETLCPNLSMHIHLP